MTTAVREAPHHNTLTCYTDYGCRRPACVERKRRWQREYRAKQRSGQPVLVDARPVREHLQALQTAGISAYRVSLIAGVDDWTVRSFLGSSSRARKHRTSPEIAAKILSVAADAPPAYSDGTGTRRRIQALAADGWPLHNVAEHVGLYPTYIRDLLRRTGSPVYTATADRVTRAYEQLRKRKPERRGIDARAVKRIRARAAAERWPTSRYWDRRPGAIDDPDFEPLYGVTRLEIVAQDAGEVMRFSGLDRQAAADRLGVDKSYIDRAFKTHPQYAVEKAA